MLGEQVDLAERAPHYTVSFANNQGAAEVPYAIQIDLIHDPDQSIGGIGEPYVVAARGGDMKSASWHGDGSNLRVILMPTGAPITDFVNFKFYVAGGIQNLQEGLGGVKAYDSTGNELTGVSALIVPHL